MPQASCRVESQQDEILAIRRNSQFCIALFGLGLLNEPCFLSPAADSFLFFNFDTIELNKTPKLNLDHPIFLPVEKLSIILLTVMVEEKYSFRDISFTKVFRTLSDLRKRERTIHFYEVEQKKGN